MSNLVEHAERELRKAGFFNKESDYGGMLGPAVLELVKVHSSQGHSGMSHAIVMQLFNQVANFKVLTPITSSPEEWTDVSEHGAPGSAPLWQNKRQSSCFSNDGGKTWWDNDDPKPPASKA